MSQERQLSIYAGRDQVGMVVDRGGGRVEAFDVSGVHLGTFKKVKAAVSAVTSPAPSPRADRAEQA